MNSKVVASFAFVVATAVFVTMVTARPPAPPSAVGDVVVSAVRGQPERVTVSWQEPRQTNGPITEYLLFHTDDASAPDQEWVVEAILGHRLSSVIDDLRLDTVYYFRVQARNANGYGPLTPPIAFRTPHASGRGGGMVEYEVGGRGGGVVGYEVDGRGGGMVGHEMGGRGGGMVGHEVDGRGGGFVGYEVGGRGGGMVGYKVEGRGGGMVGYEVDNRGGSSQTYGAGPPSAVGGVVVSAVRGRPVRATVSWQEPRQTNGQITEYLLFYTDDASVPDHEWVVEAILGHRLSSVIPDLSLDTVYYFRVQARNANGYGPLSPTVAFRTFDASGRGGGMVDYNEGDNGGGNSQTSRGPPSAVGDVVVSKVDGRPDSATVSWQEPRQTNGAITEYAVFYADEASLARGDMVRQGVLGDRRTTVISDLRLNTVYYFRVQARNANGYGPMTPPVTFRTPREGPPGDVRNVVVSAVRSRPDRATVSWQEPRETSGAITEYAVFYADDASLADRDWVIQGVLGDRRTTVISDLRLDTVYYFRVQARNAHGYGSMTPTVTFRTPNAYYGECVDRLPHLCREELQPHYCYLAHNRDICCSTCRQHQTNEPGCLYGDHHTTIVRKEANGVATNYNCQGYIGFYGRFHCQEPEFRANCCQSCKV